MEVELGITLSMFDSNGERIWVKTAVRCDEKDTDNPFPNREDIQEKAEVELTAAVARYIDYLHEIGVLDGEES